MARADVTVNKVNDAGLVSGAAGDYQYITFGVDNVQFTNNNRIFCHIKNPTASAITVTIPTPMTVAADLGVDDRTISVAANEELLVGPFNREVYSNDDDLVFIDCDEATAEIAAFQI